MKIDLTKQLCLSMLIAAIGIADAKELDSATSEAQAACEAAECIEANQSYSYYLRGGAYPDNCSLYSLSVPAGRRLDIGIRDFTVDLDIYVDRNLSVLQYDDHGQWTSNDYGTGDESVTIYNPEGRYYIQVCAYERNDGSDFILYTDFTPSG